MRLLRVRLPGQKSLNTPIARYARVRPHIPTSATGTLAHHKCLRSLRRDRPKRIPPPGLVAASRSKAQRIGRAYNYSTEALNAQLIVLESECSDLCGNERSGRQ